MYIVLYRSVDFKITQLQARPVEILPIFRVVFACCNVAVTFRESANTGSRHRDKTMIQMWHCVRLATLWPFVEIRNRYGKPLDTLLSTAKQH